MSRLDVIIVGAGLAGLYAARLLEVAGVSRYVVLDAASRVGGRIHAVEPNTMDDGGDFDALSIRTKSGHGCFT